MAKTEAGSCASLSLDGLPELPEPEKPDNTFSEGDKDSPLKYISGSAVQ